MIKKDQIVRYAGLGNNAGVENLIKEGTHPDTRGHYGMTALMAAVRKRQYAVIKLLVKYGANPNLQAECGETALMIAVRNLDMNAILILVELDNKLHTIDTNIKNTFGESAIDFLPRLDEVDEQQKELINEIRFILSKYQKI